MDAKITMCLNFHKKPHMASAEFSKTDFITWSWGWELNPYITALQAVAWTIRPPQRERK